MFTDATRAARGKLAEVLTDELGREKGHLIMLALEEYVEVMVDAAARDLKDQIKQTGEYSLEY